jgi:hypothetical protein
MMVNDNVKFFEDNKYVQLKSVLTNELINIATTYALLDERNDYALEEGGEPQIHNSHSKYSDTLMESFLLYLKPILEENTGLSLLPTYSYFRVYKPGADLKKHIDRPACEISTTVSLGFDYKGADSKYPIFVGGKECTMDPGDLVIYRGCEVEHWREVFEAPEDSFHVQFFCHYVDANGPYTEWENDKRPFIGFDKERNLIKNVSKFYFPNKPYCIFTG